MWRIEHTTSIKAITVSSYSNLIGYFRLFDNLKRDESKEITHINTIIGIIVGISAFIPV